MQRDLGRARERNREKPLLLWGTEMEETERSPDWRGWQEPKEGCIRDA